MVVTKPRCTTFGYTTCTCKNCGDVIIVNRTLPKGHKFMLWQTKTAPTCTTSGIKERRCFCGEKEVVEIAALGHDEISHAAKDATCTEFGWDAYVNCSRCDYTTYQEKEAPGHLYGEWYTTLDPTTTMSGSKERVCDVCGEIEIQEIPVIVLDERIVAYYTIVNGKVIDLVSGKEMVNAQINGKYFYGGKISLPATYNSYTIECVMVYNRTSTENPICDNFAYYGGAFMFQETTSLNNWHYIKTPFGGGQIWTDFILRTSMNYNYRVFTGGESYWAFAVDSGASFYAIQINDNYVSKSHWASAIRQTFTLSSDHMFKEFIIYSDCLTEEDLDANFKLQGVQLMAESKTLIGRIANGLAHFGSAFAFQKNGTFGIPEWLDTETETGDYTVSDGNGLDIDYSILDYIEPNLGIDHSKYESVHIIKKPETLYVDYKYALSAVPYPFNINHDGQSDQYDVSWTSSDETIAVVIDGLIIPKKNRYCHNYSNIAWYNYV